MQPPFTRISRYIQLPFTMHSHHAAPGILVFFETAGRLVLFLSPEQPSLVISLTAADLELGPFAPASTDVVGVGIRQETFSLAEDGIFLPDGAELTVTLLGVGGAAVPFVLDTTTSFFSFVSNGVATGAVGQVGTFAYQGAPLT